jgi:glycosyltransferase involved in cell wall biosynthesis
MILVWMPVYNEAKYLQMAIDSVRAQTHRDFTFIISDNHSTDGSTAIIDAACRSDTRIRKVCPPSHVPSLDHMEFLYAQILNQSTTYKYSIFIGGHDVWQANLLECLWSRAEADPNSAIVYTDSYRIDPNDNVCQKYEGIVHVAEVPLSMRPHCVLLGLTHNLVWGGLWREDKRRLVPKRHRCTAFDHLMVAEISMHGNLIYAPGSVVYLRDVRSPSADNYLKKHLPAHYLNNPVLDFALQLEWVSHLGDMAASLDRFCQQEPVKNLLKTSLVSAYICRYWIHLSWYDGGLKGFFDDERVQQLLVAAKHGNAEVSTFLRETLVLAQSQLSFDAHPESKASTSSGGLALHVAPWPSTVQRDELFTAAAVAAEAQGVDWFALADATSLEIDVQAWIVTLTSDAHDAVILFRAPEPANPSDGSIGEWLASGVAVFAVRVAWWREHSVPSASGAVACAAWATAVVDWLTKSARCYVGSVVR